MKDGSIGETVEKQILERANKALAQVLGDGFTLNGGIECTRYMGASINLDFSPPLRVPFAGDVVVLPKITFDLGIKIMQSRITVDRAINFKFAVALENCINKTTASASQRVGATQTVLSEMVPVQNAGAALVNGSVLRTIVKGFFPFEEMAGLEPVPDPRAKR
jgi:hypothetical protein